MEKASRLYKAKTGVGCDGFHPKVLLDLTKETRGKIVEFLEKVEMPTLIRWWGSPESTRSGKVGRAQKTVWEILMELEICCGKAKEEDQGAVALVLRPCQSPRGVGLGDALLLPEKDLTGTLRLL